MLLKKSLLHLLLLLVYATFTVISALAHAESGRAGERAAAEAMFQRGIALMKDEQFLEACEQFAGSLELERGIGTQLRLADCYERLGKTASAWASFKDVQAAATTRGDERRVAIAAERLLTLEARLSYLTLELDTQDIARDGSTLRLDGVELPSSLSGSAFPVDPGPRELELSAKGFETWQMRVNIKPGPSSNRVRVPRLSPQTLPSSAPLASPGNRRLPRLNADARAETRPQANTLGIVSTAVGIAGLVVGGVFAYLAYSSNEESMSECLTDNPNLCSTRGSEKRREALAQAKLASISTGIGGAASVLGVTLLLWPDGDSPATAANQTAASTELRLLINGEF